MDIGTAEIFNNDYQLRASRKHYLDTLNNSTPLQLKKRHQQRAQDQQERLPPNNRKNASSRAV